MFRGVGPISKLPLMMNGVASAGGAKQAKRSRTSAGEMSRLVGTSTETEAPDDERKEREQLTREQGASR